MVCILYRNPMLLVVIFLAWIPVFAHSGTCGGYTGGLAHGASYTISSPNYPGNYDRNANCIWLFAATNFTELRVNVSYLQLEANSDGSCKDYLLITEGNATANKLGNGTLCRPTDTIQLSTLSRFLWIQFRSDHQVQRSGFSLTVTAVGNLAANATDSPFIACQTTQLSCPNKQCVELSYICDNVNDCGCVDYGCDESKCWTYPILNSIAFNWGLGVGIGFFIGLLLLIIFGLYEMPQHKRPECLKRSRTEVPENACLLACTQRCKRNKVEQRKPGDQFKSMLEKMSAGKHPLRWETESESDIAQGGGYSRRTSATGPGSVGGSRRSSYQMSSSYGNTLSPSDMPQRPAGTAPSPRSAAAAAGASTSSRTTGTTLAVPTATSSV